MAPKHNVNDEDSAPENSSGNESTSTEEPKSAAEPAKKKIRIVDTTNENQGKGFAFIGGVRAPKN